MLLYKVISLALEYPSQELYDHLPEIHECVCNDADITRADRQALLAFIDWARSRPLLELQEAYVRTFDLSPNNALYLTHHLYEEEDRDRGPTLVELDEYFKSQGFALAGGELPDYLPLVLEYVSTLDDELSANVFLAQSAHVCEIIATNLEKTASPYAPLLRTIERHGRLAEACTG